MHIIDIQYFKGAKIKTLSAMHDLRAMYEKTLEYAKEMFENDTDDTGNFQFYPRKAKMSDLQVIALAVAAESACIDSENWLYSKLRTDYRTSFPELIDRTRFNRRRRQLQERIVELTKRLSMTLGVESSIMIVDSMPCPIVKNSRERSFSICKEDAVNAPRKGYSAVDKRYFIGYKLHLLTSEHGVFQDMQVTPGNVHDINFLKDVQLEDYTKGKTLLGDRGYISKAVQTDLFTTHDITLEVPYRSNQKEQMVVDKVKGRKRRRIEVLFSQLCDQFRIKLNYAKSFAGFLGRVASKLAAVAVLQRVNVEKGRPLNQIKHAWSQ